LAFLLVTLKEGRIVAVEISIGLHLKNAAIKQSLFFQKYFWAVLRFNARQNERKNRNYMRLKMFS
jgi:hypothetical protein